MRLLSPSTATTTRTVVIIRRPKEVVTAVAFFLGHRRCPIEGRPGQSFVDVLRLSHLNLLHGLLQLSAFLDHSQIELSLDLDGALLLGPAILYLLVVPH